MICVSATPHPVERFENAAPVTLNLVSNMTIHGHLCFGVQQHSNAPLVRRLRRDVLNYTEKVAVNLLSFREEHTLFLLLSLLFCLPLVLTHISV